jgi:hypothetical protein
MKITPARIAGILIALFLIAFLVVPEFPKMLGIKLGQEEVAQTPTEQKPVSQTPAEVTKPEVKPAPVCRLLGHPVQYVNLYIRDKLSPRTAISGVKVEVFTVPEDTSIENLARIASDPNRIAIDSGTSDASGKVVFNASVMGQGNNYVFSVRGDSSIYDDIEILQLPCYDEPVTTATFISPKLVYKVGSFQDIHTDADNILTGAEYDQLNLTKQAGKTSVFFSTDITIGEAEAGKVLKNAVLVLRIPEGVSIPEGAIKSIVIVPKMGTIYPIPGVNLVSYLTASTPIPLKDVMTVADSGTYTVKIEYDATLMPNEAKLQLVLDDLGDYRAKDLVTRDFKASPMTLELLWQS